jgi:hypothetical protein
MSKNISEFTSKNVYFFNPDLAGFNRSILLHSAFPEIPGEKGLIWSNSGLIFSPPLIVLSRYPFSTREQPAPTLELGAWNFSGRLELGRLELRAAPSPPLTTDNISFIPPFNHKRRAL